MTAGERVSGRRAAPVAAPPRRLIVVVLAAAAAATVIAGLTATAWLLLDAGMSPAAIPALFWPALAAAMALTVLALGLRSLRWAFLLRRAEVRIPLRDATIGYLAGLSLLFVPFLAGETVVRAWVLRQRCGVPVAVTALLNLWERYLDLLALLLIASVTAALLAPSAAWGWAGLALVTAAIAGPTRRFVLRVMVVVVNGALRLSRIDAALLDHRRLEKLTGWREAMAAATVSVVAWAVPGAGLFLLVASWQASVSLPAALNVFATSGLLGGLVLAPGGVLVVGGSMLAALEAAGMGEAGATLTVFAVRVATVGVAVALGVIFLLIHRRTLGGRESGHFDAIAHAYEAQIPEARREGLLRRKTAMMQRVLLERGMAGARGLDVGCGQGWYLARMRRLGFDVHGIDDSRAQVTAAADHVAQQTGAEGMIGRGSALAIPYRDGSFDFAYCVNVLHHLGSDDDQRMAFAELLRVLRPGGLLFVHEINTRNLLFRLYMGYVFPSINCIDEGVERWLLPAQLPHYTPNPVERIEYFTFLPEFLPARLLRLLEPVERRLERSSLRGFSAHYMAVLQAAGTNGAPESLLLGRRAGARE